MYSELLMSRLIACDCCDLKEKARSTKHSILVAALNLFMKDGFMKTPVREICRKAGVAKGTFYLYFETKDSVLLNLIELLFVELDDLVLALDSTNPSLDQVDQIIDNCVYLMEKEKDMLHFMHSPEILMFVGEDAPHTLFNSMKSSVSSWMESAIEKGVIKDTITTFSFEIIVNIIHDTLEKALLHEYPGQIDVVSEELKKLIKNMLI